LALVREAQILPLACRAPFEAPTTSQCHLRKRMGADQLSIRIGGHDFILILAESYEAQMASLRLRVVSKTTFIS